MTNPAATPLLACDPSPGDDGAVIRALSARLVAETDPLRVLSSTAEAIGRHLGVACVAYGEVDADSEWIDFPVDWTDGSGRVGVAGRHPFWKDGWSRQRYATGETLAVPDVRTLTFIRDEAERMAASGSAAFIAVPLLKDGEVAAIFSAISAEPREWTTADARLMEEAAAVTWRSLDHLRLTLRLRERDRHQAFLIDWADAVRAETGSKAILDLTLARLGAYLDVVWLNYVEVSADERFFTVFAQYVANGPSTVGRTFPVEVIGRAVFEALYARQLVCIDDTSNHPLIPVAARPHYSAIGVGAFMGVPLTRQVEIPAVLVAQTQGVRRWTDGEAQLLRDVADRLWAIIERARIEEQLRESEGLLTAFMANAPIGMHLKDADGAFIRINPTLAAGVGIDPADAVGRRAADLLPATMAAEIAAIDTAALAGRTASVELNLSKGAEPLSLLSIAFPITAGGEATRIGGFTLDVTERKRAEAALERSREALFQSEKLSALGSLLAGVSHELNNPLSIVVAQAVMLERQSRGGELAERAGKIRKAADRCARIVQTFLAMARQKRPERQPVDLNAIAVAALELTEYGLRNAGVAVRRELTPMLPRIAADADQLHQIIVNLLVNAQHAMTNAHAAVPELIVRTMVVDGGVALEVADNGPGVPEPLRRRIFEPFYTTKAQGQGTGVGLSFSQGLAEAHGGRLELAPSRIGACFRLTLPVGEGVALPAGVAASVSEPERPAARALIVDDEAEIADALSDFLGLEGYRCEIAIGGAAARDRLAAGASYDLVVSDLRMPDMDGPQLHAWMLQHRPDLVDRLAFATGDTLGAGAATFLDQARRPVLEKPFTPEAVRRFLDRMGAR